MKIQLTTLKRNTNLIFKMAKVDMTRRFKSSILSWFWLFLQPALLIFIYWFAFSANNSNSTNLIDITINNVTTQYSWISWVLIGVFSWSYCGDLVLSGPSSMKSYAWMMKSFGISLYIPQIFVNLSKFIIGFSLMMIAWLITIIINATDNNPETFAITWRAFEIPIVFILMFLFMFAWTSLFSSFFSISRDFQNLILMAPMILAWITGVFLIPNPTGGNEVINIIIQLNPFYFLMNIVRGTMMGYSDIFHFNEYYAWYSLLSFFLFLFTFSILAFIMNKNARKFIIDIM